MSKSTLKCCWLKSLIKNWFFGFCFEFLDPILGFVALDLYVLNGRAWESSDFTMARNILWELGEHHFGDGEGWGRGGSLQIGVMGESRGKSPPRVTEASDTSVSALDNCSLSPPALEFCSFLHNPDTRPKQPWGQLECPWWLISSWRGDSEGSSWDPCPETSESQQRDSLPVPEHLLFPNPVLLSLEAVAVSMPERPSFFFAWAWEVSIN